MSEGKSLLIVDDDDTFRARLARAFSERGYVVRTAADGANAVELARADSPELAIVDLKMPGMSGVDVVRTLHANDPTTRIVMLTGYGSVTTVVDALHSGAIDYLQKPTDVARLIVALEGRSSSAAEDARAVPDVSLARAEWEHIQRVMHDCGGNVSEAARRLGIHRRSLQRKLQKTPPTR